MSSPAPRRVVGALFVDFGDQNRPPRARYECVPCNYRSDIVTGPDAIAAFTATASDIHRTVCPSRQENHQ
ncbi:hypothetical protein ACIQRK_32225 [Streptomyces anulatus]